MVNEKINSWTFEETIKTAENLMKNEKIYIYIYLSEMYYGI